MGQYKSRHLGSTVDTGVDFAHALSTDKAVLRAYIESITPTGDTLTAGSLLLEGTYYYDTTDKKVKIGGYLTTGDTNTNPIITLKEAGDRNAIHKSLREDYEEAHTITLVEGENTLAEYSTKHIVGVDSEDITGVTLLDSTTDEIFRYKGSITTGSTTEYLYVKKGTALPIYSTLQSDRSKITSFGYLYKFMFTGSDYDITSVGNDYIIAGPDAKTYKIDAMNDLVYNTLEDTTHPNYFAWTTIDGSETIYTSVMSPTTTDKAKTGTVTWSTDGTINVKRDTYNQGVTLKKGTIKNMEDETTLEELKDGLTSTAKKLASIAKTSDIGDLTKLFTEAKQNLVEAINELEERVRVFTTTYDPLKEAREGDVWISTNN